MSNQLPELIATANTEHGAALKSRAEMLEHMRKSGEALQKVKDGKLHQPDSWMDWLEKNFDGSYASANQYINLAKNWDKTAVSEYRESTPAEEQSLRGALYAAGKLKNPKSRTDTDDSSTTDDSSDLRGPTQDEMDAAESMNANADDDPDDPENIEWNLIETFTRCLHELTPDEIESLARQWEKTFWPSICDTLRDDAGTGEQINQAA